ncbi:MAG: RluA family pseudouridine synthase, partial [Bdellovibrionota bacterium]
KIRTLIVAGAVYLNGKRVGIASKELLPGVKVDVWIDREKLLKGPASSDRHFEMTERSILFEDDYLILVNKPPGLPTQPTLDEARDHLFASVKKFIGRRTGGEVYLGLHHRLDRDTSGVVLFTKKPEANAGAAKLFSEHLAQKTYVALSQISTSREIQQFQEAWTVKNYLKRSGAKSKKAHYQSVRSGGDFAHTDFRILEKFKEVLYIEAKPKTGRTHQIRVHLSEQGLPILGDLNYGYREDHALVKAPRLMLHAVCLTFPHPIFNTSIVVQSPLPEDFCQCLQALKSRKN